jgi:hypothetical protein
VESYSVFNPMPRAADSEPQAPDPRPGFYYVSVVRGAGDYRLLRGPFVNDHAGALAAVEAARYRAYDLDPRSAWYAYGTARLEADAGPGILDRIDAAVAAKEAA